LLLVVLFGASLVGGNNTIGETNNQKWYMNKVF